ncbi:hypothetical protein [Azotobacter beijerinckii]|uniref:hypothetical protein n=1 Tax=Azotobacter beijerinckii TaxID=170623 RepID=UPI002953D1F1|nr:hypothetical protein [Azotobacter beijerinckii]MDV7209889.1 hypothetical protein [Azotobacter beijerinckii]
MIDWSQMKTAEQKAAEAATAELGRINAAARAYLTSTDWYILRLQETGEPVPPDVLEQRAAARAQVVE